MVKGALRPNQNSYLRNSKYCVIINVILRKSEPEK